MKHFQAMTIIPLVLLFCGVTMAVDSTIDEPLPDLLNVDQLESVPSSPAVTATDSLYLLGGPGVLSGKFQDAAGLPDRQGWTGIDLHQDFGSHWQVSTYNAAALDPETVDNHAWWCGDYFEPCNENDPAEGYGNGWTEYLDWYGTVPDPGSDLILNIQAVISYDVEPAEDFLHLRVDNSEWMEELVTFGWQATAEIVNVTATLTPDYFVGEEGDQVHLRWAFNSDGAFSDEDCLWPTAGAAQIDLISVTFDQGDGPIQIGTTETCEPGDPLQWIPSPPLGPGDFSKVWPQLDDADPDAQNDTPQFAFIDDGLVVPGTGGYPCISHCYGPGGFIVNPDGGLSELHEFLHNEIWSPVIPVPDGDWNAAVFSFDQYVHTEFDNGGPRIFGIWHVRSTADPDGLTGWTEWRDRNLVFWGEPRYVRNFENITDLLEPGFTHIQLALGARHYMYNYNANDGTPAPYFDNVALKVYRNVEPSVLLVKPDGSGDYPNIQAAISASADLDTVLLADGVYSGEGNHDIHFLGREVYLGSRSGDPESCIIDLQGGPGEIRRGFRFAYQEGSGSVLSGLTILGGYQDQDSAYNFYYSGGAVACGEGSAPTISNCIFTGNRISGEHQQGGAIFCEDASPLIVDCVFQDNRAVDGGAIAATGLCNVVVRNCLFVANEASHNASGVFAHYPEAHITLSSCTFSGNINPYYTGTVVSSFRGRLDIDHTIVAFSTDGFGLTLTYPEDVSFNCTNIFGNPAGDWYHHFADQLGVDGNISQDPVFCLDNNPDLPFGLDETSPCSPEHSAGCGLIGSMPVSCGSTSSVNDSAGGVPQSRLFTCFPNPFNPRTHITFNLPEAGPIELKIYTLDGRLVKTLFNEVMSAGAHEVHWSGRDDQGRAVASGVFLARLKAGKSIDSIRMVLVR